jgi:amino acid adenylation domain-containing protein
MDISDQDVYVFPASFAQRRMWFLDQFQPGSPFYNVPMAVRIKGALRVAALEQGIRGIVRRHESLRTTFAVMDGEPVQVIHKDGPAMNIALDRVDIRRLSAPEREAEIHRRAMAEAQLPFNLAEGPLLRATLLKLGERDHVLLLTMHHIVSDAWSQGVFIQEMAVLYDMFSKEKPSPLPDLPLQYADFTEWQRAWLQGEVMEAHLDYWRGRLRDNPPPLRLPTDYPRPSVQTARGAKLSRSLPKPLANALQKVSQREGATLFMTLLAAFQALLHRYTGQDDISVGTPVANRNRAEIEGLIGCFINTLVMRTDLSGDPSFRELLRRAREVALGAYAHQDLPFEKLVEELKPERDMSRQSLFQVMLILQNVPRKVEIGGHGLTLSVLKIDKGTSNFDLTLTMVEEAKGLNAMAEYNTDLFEAATIERLLQHFQTLLEGIVSDPDRRISDLPLLNEAERRLLLSAWNDTRREYPRDKCVHELFEAQVERSPDAIALVVEEEQLTYRELNRRANQLAAYLGKLGVGPETPVGFCLERSPEMVVGILGILKAGGTYVPLDPAYPKERLAFMLEDTRTPVILVQQRLIERLPEHQARVVRIDADWELMGQESEGNRASGATAGHLAYVMYTSGSTGRPKGIAIPHRAINRLVFNTNYIEITSDDRMLLASNSAFDAATFELWGALLHGARLVGVSREAVLSPQELAASIRDHGISAMWLTAALFNQMTREVPKAFGSVRHLLIGGEALDPHRVREALKNDPPARLVNGYGPTEGTTFTTWYLAQEAAEGATSIPIGRPISNTQTYLLDRNQQPTPLGIAGELYIGGDGLARGYFNGPELTAEKFIPNPYSERPGARLYRTGDLSRYLPDGAIEFLGRLDHQVKIRGFRIELGEIETTLQQHPAIREAVVLAREDEPGNKRLVAYLVSVQEEAPTIGELHSFLRQKLPWYMAPAAYVWLEFLPMTPNGKIDRRAMPAPDKTQPELEAAFVAPRTPAEERLAAIYAEVLCLERVGISDHFFDLGGHSLLATQVASRVRQAFEIELPLRSLFETPTVAGLAENIESILWAAQSSQSPLDSAADDREEGEI